MVTIKDVADLAGVSSSTVSRVLNDRNYIKEETRQKVQGAMNALGYKPSRLARGLRFNKSRIIGLIISDIQNPFFTGLVRAVEDIAHENNYALILANTDEDPQKEELNVDLMISERVAGVIITPTKEYNCPVKKLINNKIPVVCVDRRILDCDVDIVLLDNVSASKNLVDHLLSMNHRRIGAILGPSDVTTGRERLLGMKNAFEEKNIPLDENLILQSMPKEENGYKLAHELFALADPPTAIFAGNNLLALGAMRAIKELGLKIPDDISMVSFDDSTWSELVQPSITVVAQPTYEIGRIAAELIMRRIEDINCSVTTVMLESQVLFRESVLPLVTI